MIFNILIFFFCLATSLTYAKNDKFKERSFYSEKQLTENLSFFSLNAAHSNQTELPEPYRSVQLLPFDPQSFYGNARELETLIRRHHIKVVIEVGSWLGASTRHIASLLPEEGKVYAVDHWMGSIEHQPGNSAYYPAVSYAYQQFLSNVIHAGLTNKIVPIKMQSLDAAKLPCFVQKEIIPDLIYIDAGHSTEEVYADLLAWYPFVEKHGILCGDDWGWNSVREAVIKFAQENSLGIGNNGDNFWLLKNHADE